MATLYNRRQGGLAPPPIANLQSVAAGIGDIGKGVAAAIVGAEADAVRAEADAALSAGTSPVARETAWWDVVGQKADKAAAGYIKKASGIFNTNMLRQMDAASALTETMSKDERQSVIQNLEKQSGDFLGSIDDVHQRVDLEGRFALLISQRKAQNALYGANEDRKQVRIEYAKRRDGIFDDLAGLVEAGDLEGLFNYAEQLGQDLPEDITAAEVTQLGNDQRAIVNKVLEAMPTFAFNGLEGGQDPVAIFQYLAAKDGLLRKNGMTEKQARNVASRSVGAAEMRLYEEHFTSSAEGYIVTSSMPAEVKAANTKQMTAVLEYYRQRIADSKYIVGADKQQALNALDAQFKSFSDPDFAENELLFHELAEPAYEVITDLHNMKEEDRRPALKKAVDALVNRIAERENDFPTKKEYHAAVTRAKALYTDPTLPTKKTVKELTPTQIGNNLQTKLARPAYDLIAKADTLDEKTAHDQLKGKVKESLAAIRAAKDQFPDEVTFNAAIRKTQNLLSNPFAREYEEPAPVMERINDVPSWLLAKDLSTAETIEQYNAYRLNLRKGKKGYNITDSRKWGEVVVASATRDFMNNPKAVKSDGLGSYSIDAELLQDIVRVSTKNIDAPIGKGEVFAQGNAAIERLENEVAPATIFLQASSDSTIPGFVESYLDNEGRINYRVNPNTKYDEKMIVDWALELADLNFDIGGQPRAPFGNPGTPLASFLKSRGVIDADDERFWGTGLFERASSDDLYRRVTNRKLGERPTGKLTPEQRGVARLLTNGFQSWALYDMVSATVGKAETDAILAKKPDDLRGDIDVITALAGMFPESVPANVAEAMTPRELYSVALLQKMDGATVPTEGNRAMRVEEVVVEEDKAFFRGRDFKFGDLQDPTRAEGPPSDYLEQLPRIEALAVDLDNKLNSFVYFKGRVVPRVYGHIIFDISKSGRTSRRVKYFKHDGTPYRADLGNGFEEIELIIR